MTKSSSFDLHLSLALQLKEEVERFDAEIKQLEEFLSAVTEKLEEVKEMRGESLDELIITTALVTKVHAEKEKGERRERARKKRKRPRGSRETPRAKRARRERERFASMKRHWERRRSETVEE